jgi:hypothetical protein
MQVVPVPSEPNEEKYFYPFRDRPESSDFDLTLSWSSKKDTKIAMSWLDEVNCAIWASNEDEDLALQLCVFCDTFVSGANIIDMLRETAKSPDDQDRFMAALVKLRDEIDVMIAEAKAKE